MGERTYGRRSAALRKAQEAKQLRDARRLVREREIEGALADFFEQTDRAGRLVEQARQRAERILAEAEEAAREPHRLAGQALARLVVLGETRTAIAELTGLSLSQVRAALTGVETTDVPAGTSATTTPNSPAVSEGTPAEVAPTAGQPPAGTGSAASAGSVPATPRRAPATPRSVAADATVGSG